MTDRLHPATFGTPTLHARVENWECDFNGHWNARFYGRSFQLAAEMIAHPGGSKTAPTRVIRFHGELFPGAAVEVRSAQLTDGRHPGAIVHALFSGERLSATALDLGGAPVAGLPLISEAAAKLALPRSLDAATAGWTEGCGTSLCPTGPTRPAEMDHRGNLLFEEIIRRVAFAIHNHVGALGLNETYLKETGISRMAVESRVTRIGNVPVGTPLRVRTRITRRAVKSFVVAHLLESHSGAPLAFAQHSLLTVNLNTRRAVELPAFLRE